MYEYFEIGVQLVRCVRAYKDSLDVILIYEMSNGVPYGIYIYMYCVCVTELNFVCL